MPEFARKRDSGPIVTTMDCADESVPTSRPVSLAAMSRATTSGRCQPCFGCVANVAGG
jgi:hypothetical protein